MKKERTKMSEEELKAIYEKTKGIMHITQHKRFWDYFNLLKEESSLVDKQQKEIKKLEEQKRGLLVETYKKNDEKDKETEKEKSYTDFYKDLCDKQQKKLEEIKKILKEYGKKEVEYAPELYQKIRKVLRSKR